MYIIFDSKGVIKQASETLSLGVNIIGELDGYVNLDDLNLYSLSGRVKKDFLLDEDISLIDGDAILIKLDSCGRFEWISRPISSKKDVFFSELSIDQYIVGDDFFEILSMRSNVSLSLENIRYFINLGYFYPSKTYFKEVLRLELGNKLVLGKGNLKIKSIWDYKKVNRKYNYNLFKRSFDSVLECSWINSRDVLLLSGGVDSGLIAAVASIKFGQSLKVRTLRYKDPFRFGDLDVYRAGKISSLLKLEHTIVDFDLNNIDIGSLANYINLTPLSTNLSLLAFNGIIEFLNDNSRIWSGLNADILSRYFHANNTDLGILIRDLCLSKYYVSSFEDIATNNYGCVMIRRLLCLLYSFKGKGYRLPGSFQELMYCVKRSGDYLDLSHLSSNLHIKPNIDKIDLNHAMRLLVDKRIQCFVSNGHAKIFSDLAGSYSHKHIDPFSAVNMIYFFRGLDRGALSLFGPKSYICRYLEELLGKKDYNKVYNSKKISLRNRSYAEWYKNVFYNSKFSLQLRDEISGFKLENIEIYKKVQNIQSLISIYWIKKVVAKSKELVGVLNC